MKLLKNLSTNQRIIGAIAIIVLIVGSVYFIGNATKDDSLNGGIITPTLLVTDVAGVTTRVGLPGQNLVPGTVIVSGIENPDCVGVEWNIKVTTDVPSDVTVKFKSTQSEFGLKPYWDINADWSTPGSGMEEYQDSEGYWTQIIHSGVDTKLWVAGQEDWGWFLAFPQDGIGGAEGLENLLAGFPDGDYTCDWRVYGYAEASGVRDNFDVTAPIKVSKVGGTVTSLTLDISPTVTATT